MSIAKRIINKFGTTYEDNGYDQKIVQGKSSAEDIEKRIDALKKKAGVSKILPGNPHYKEYTGLRDKLKKIQHEIGNIHNYKIAKDNVSSDDIKKLRSDGDTWYDKSKSVKSELNKEADDHTNADGTDPIGDHKVEISNELKNKLLNFSGDKSSKEYKDLKDEYVNSLWDIDVHYDSKSQRMGSHPAVNKMKKLSTSARSNAMRIEKTGEIEKAPKKVLPAAPKDANPDNFENEYDDTLKSAGLDSDDLKHRDLAHQVVSNMANGKSAENSLKDLSYGNGGKLDHNDINPKVLDYLKKLSSKMSNMSPDQKKTLAKKFGVP